MSDQISQKADELESQDDGAALEASPARQKIELLFRLLRSSGDAVPTGPSPGDSNSVSQRFRILRRHARGGLGDIWIAHDEKLNRQVALKEIQPQFAGHSQSRSRFLREATITGQLEHPGIVPIYALGRHENGQPFYAMRYVQGDTLQHAIARFHGREEPANQVDLSNRHASPTRLPQWNLELRKLVTRLIDVCNTVAYAHSRGILHRDIKPSNIMLGEFGETLVVDWGLAKPFGEITDTTGFANDNSAAGDSPSEFTLRDTPAPTLIGSTIGSPPYMSPEQAAGRMDTLGPATDIYSLGATLFELLTGQFPIGARAGNEQTESLSDAEILQRARDGRFPRPSTVNPKVPRALESVCLKAMALRPEDRYATVRDLGSDLEAWLADEPVSAWTEPTAVRARRWMRHHQTAVVATLATVLVAVLGLSVSLAIIADRNERLADGKKKLESMNRQLTESNLELNASNKRERDALRGQEEETARANEKAEAARRAEADAKAVSDYVVGLFQSFDPLRLNGVIGVGSAAGDQRGIDLTVPQLLDAGRHQLETNAELEKRPALYSTLLDTLGDLYRAFGYRDKAEPWLRRAEAIRLKEFGEEHLETATSYFHLGCLRHEQSEFSDAENYFRRARQVQQKLNVAPLKLAATKFHLAWLLAHQYDQPSSERVEEAESLFREVLTVRQKELGNLHRDVGLTYAALAFIKIYKGQDSILASLYSLPELTQAVAILEGQGDQDPASGCIATFLAANSAWLKQDFHEAQRLYKAVLEQSEPLLGERHPWRILILGIYAGALRKNNDLTNAEATIRKAISFARQSAMRWHPKFVEALVELGQLCKTRNDLKESEELFSEALNTALRINRRDLAKAPYLKLASLLREQGRDAEANMLSMP